MGGEQHARFSNLVLPHLADALALARWLTGSTADAEDVVQDACLRAFRAIDGYAGGSARAWFLTIVRNAAYTWLKKNRPAQMVSIDDVEAVMDDGSSAVLISSEESPEAALMLKTGAERLQGAIMTLPPEFRETLVLREVHGLAYRDIAAVTGTPVGTVMSRLARARRRLLADLAGDVR